MATITAGTAGITAFKLRRPKFVPKKETPTTSKSNNNEDEETTSSGCFCLKKASKKSNKILSDKRSKYTDKI